MIYLYEFYYYYFYKMLLIAKNSCIFNYTHTVGSFRVGNDKINDSSPINSVTALTDSKVIH